MSKEKMYRIYDDDGDTGVVVSEEWHKEFMAKLKSGDYNFSVNGISKGKMKEEAECPSAWSARVRCFTRG